MLIFRLYIWKTFIHKLAIVTKIINKTKPFMQLIDRSKLLHYSHGSQTCRTSDTAVSSARFLSSRCARAPYQILHAGDMRGRAGVRSAKPVYKQAPQIKTDHGLARSTLVAHIYEERDPFGFLLLSPPPPHTAHSTHSTSSHSRRAHAHVSSTECVISTAQTLRAFVPYSN